MRFHEKKQQQKQLSAFPMQWQFLNPRVEMLHPRNGKFSNAMGQKDEENEKQKSRKENRAFFYSTR